MPAISYKQILRELEKIGKQPRKNQREYMGHVQMLTQMLGQLSDKKLNKVMEELKPFVSDNDLFFAFLMANTIGSALERGGDPNIAGREIIKLGKKIVYRAHEFGIGYEKFAKTSPNVNPQSLMQQYGKLHPQQGQAIRLIGQLGPCLGAVFSSSKELRKLSANDADLYDTLLYLARHMEGLRYVTEAFFIMDDTPFVVLYPEGKRGWIVQTEGITNLHQFDALLSAKIVGDPSEGKVPGEVPSKEALESLTVPGVSRRMSFKENFELANWTGLTDDNKLVSPFIAATPEGHKWLSHDQIPADIKELSRQRVLLIGTPKIGRSTNAQKTFTHMKADLKIEREMSAEEVEDWIETIHANR